MRRVLAEPRCECVGRARGTCTSMSGLTLALNFADHAVEIGLRDARVLLQALDQLVDGAAHVLEVLGDAARVQVARAAGRERARVDLALDGDAEAVLGDRLLALHALRAARRRAIDVREATRLG